MTHVYENKYGFLELEVVGDYKPVETIYSRDVSEACLFTIDEAEQIALITGNFGIQISFASPNFKRAFVIRHESFGIAAVCRIKRLMFDGAINAQEELESFPKIAPW